MSPLRFGPLTALQAPAWRLAHPAALGWMMAMELGTLAVWAPLGLVLSLLFVASLAQEFRWRRRARRAGLAARWVIPTSRRWWNRRLTRLGLPPVPPGGALWEIHVQDDHRWIAPTPQEAAHQFRLAYRRDMAYWIHTRPIHVAIAGSTFNALTAEETAIILEAGGHIAAGAIHPRLARRMTPRAYRHLQTRLFGGVVSNTVRHDPTRWTTWIVPPILV